MPVAPLVVLVALGKCNLWLRISGCVDIIAFDQHVCVCRYVVCRSFAFTPVAGVQSCAGCHLLFKGKQPNVTDVLFYLVFLVGNLVYLPFFFTSPRMSLLE